MRSPCQEPHTHRPGNLDLRKHFLSPCPFCGHFCSDLVRSYCLSLNLPDRANESEGLELPLFSPVGPKIAFGVYPF